jgi:hypothetical protein
MISLIRTEVTCRFLYNSTCGFSARVRLSGNLVLKQNSKLVCCISIQATNDNLLVPSTNVAAARFYDIESTRPYRNAETVVTVGNVLAMLTMDVAVQLTEHRSVQLHKTYKGLQNTVRWHCCATDAFPK